MHGLQGVFCHFSSKNQCHWTILLNGVDKARDYKDLTFPSLSLRSKTILRIPQIWYLNDRTAQKILQPEISEISVIINARLCRVLCQNWLMPVLPKALQEVCTLLKSSRFMLCEPQARQMPGKAAAAGKHAPFLSHPCNQSQPAVLP